MMVQLGSIAREVLEQVARNRVNISAGCNAAFVDAVPLTRCEDAASPDDDTSSFITFTTGSAIQASLISNTANPASPHALDTRSLRIKCHTVAHAFPSVYLKKVASRPSCDILKLPASAPKARPRIPKLELTSPDDLHATHPGGPLFRAAPRFRRQRYLPSLRRAVFCSTPGSKHSI